MKTRTSPTNFPDVKIRVNLRRAPLKSSKMPSTKSHKISPKFKASSKLPDRRTSSKSTVSELKKDILFSRKSRATKSNKDVELSGKSNEMSSDDDSDIITFNTPSPRKTSKALSARSSLESSMKSPNRRLNVDNNRSTINPLRPEGADYLASRSTRNNSRLSSSNKPELVSTVKKVNEKTGKNPGLSKRQEPTTKIRPKNASQKLQSSNISKKVLSESESSKSLSTRQSRSSVSVTSDSPKKPISATKLQASTAKETKTPPINKKRPTKRVEANEKLTKVETPRSSQRTSVKTDMSISSNIKNTPAVKLTRLNSRTIRNTPRSDATVVRSTPIRSSRSQGSVVSSSGEKQSISNGNSLQRQTKTSKDNLKKQAKTSIRSASKSKVSYKESDSDWESENEIVISDDESSNNNERISKTPTRSNRRASRNKSASVKTPAIKLKRVSAKEIEKQRQEDDLKRLCNQAVWKVDQIFELEDVNARNKQLQTRIDNILKAGSKPETLGKIPPMKPDKLRKLFYDGKKAEFKKATVSTLKKEIDILDKKIEGMGDVMDKNMELESKVEELLHPAESLNAQQIEERRKKEQIERQKQVQETILRMQKQKAEEERRIREAKESQINAVDKATGLLNTVINNLMLGYQNGGEWPADLNTALTPMEIAMIPSTPEPSTSTAMNSFQTPTKDESSEVDKVQSDSDSDIESSSVDDISASSTSSSEEETARRRSRKGKKKPSKNKKKSKDSKGKSRKRKLAMESDSESESDDDTKKKTKRSSSKKGKSMKKVKSPDSESETEIPTRHTRFSRSQSSSPAKKSDRKSRKNETELSGKQTRSSRTDSKRRGKKTSTKKSESDSDPEINFSPRSSRSSKSLTKEELSGRGNRRKARSSKQASSDSEIEFSPHARGRSKTTQGKKKVAKNRKVQDSSSESSDGEKIKSSKRSKSDDRKKRKRARYSSSDDGSGTSDSESDDKSPTAKGRRKIRRLIKARKLENATKEAARAERERLKRVEKLQSQHKVVQIEDPSSPTRCPITTQLVLEFDKKKKPLVQVNKNLVRYLKPHQVEGVQFLWDSCIETVDMIKKQKGSGCILAHCMGLGKTLSVISLVHTLLTHKCTNMTTCLVVCPLNTVLNWENEWKKWLDKKDWLDVYELASVKTNKERAGMLENWHKSGGIMIMGYQIFRILANGTMCKSEKWRTIFRKTLVNPGADIVVCDEGHVLKNDASGIAKCMNSIKTARRIVLTGTPLQNNLIEYHCMVQFVKPNLLGTRKEFCNRFGNPITNGQCSDSTPVDVKLMKRRAHVLHDLLAGCVQRKDYSVITRYLPEKCEYVLSVRLSPVQMELYQRYLNQVGRGEGLIPKGALVGAKLFTDYHNLLHIWTHPWVLRLDEIRREQKIVDNGDENASDIDLIESASDSDIVIINDTNVKERAKVSKKSRGTESSDTEEEIIKKWSSMRHDKTIVNKIESSVPGPREPQWWHELVHQSHQMQMELGGKLVLLFDILRLSAENNEKILVFSHSLLSLDLIEHFLHHEEKKSKEADNKKGKKNVSKKKGNPKETKPGPVTWKRDVDYFRMDGSTMAQWRKKWVAEFQDPKNNRARLFLISTKAGGLGINLEAANRVVIFDASWNPSHDIQSIFRIYRFGQAKPCFVYRLVAQGTMEEKIYERQVIKQTLSKRVIDEQQIQRHFTADDLQELYMFRPVRVNDQTEKETPKLPKDAMLAELLKDRPEWIVRYHEHDSLLENQENEGLSEEERKAAWEEYEAEKKGDKQNEAVARQMVVTRFQNQVKMQLPNLVQAILKQHPDITQEQLHERVQLFLDMQVKTYSRAAYQQQENIKKQMEYRNQFEFNRLRDLAQQKQLVGFAAPVSGISSQQAVPHQSGFPGVFNQGNAAQGLIAPGPVLPQILPKPLGPRTEAIISQPRYFTTAYQPRIISQSQPRTFIQGGQQYTILPTSSLGGLGNLQSLLTGVNATAGSNIQVLQVGPGMVASTNTGQPLVLGQPQVGNQPRVIVQPSTTNIGGHFASAPSQVIRVPVARVTPSVASTSSNTVQVKVGNEQNLVIPSSNVQMLRLNPSSASVSLLAQSRGSARK